jgi:hypothetical protein
MRTCSSEGSPNLHVCFADFLEICHEIFHRPVHPSAHPTMVLTSSTASWIVINPLINLFSWLDHNVTSVSFIGRTVVSADLYWASGFDFRSFFPKPSIILFALIISSRSLLSSLCWKLLILYSLTVPIKTFQSSDILRMKCSNVHGSDQKAMPSLAEYSQWCNFIGKGHIWEHPLHFNGLLVS